MANDKQQVWKFTKTQQLLIVEQAKAHAREQQPLIAYQAADQQSLLVAFKEELGIPEDLPLTVDLENLQFVLRPPTPEEPVQLDVDPRGDALDHDPALDENDE